MARTSRAKRSKKTPQKIAPPPEPASVSAAELAAILSDKPFTDRWLRELADKGYVVRAGRARYELAASVQGYIRFIRETEVERQIGSQNARAEFEAERARKLKLENDERESILIGTPLAIAAVDYIVGTLRTDLAAVPARASEDVATRRRVENAIDDVLNSLADRFAKAGDALAQGVDPIEADEEAAA
jgi:phage terminase Nu1 subunit (DNA packaging protein)